MKLVLRKIMAAVMSMAIVAVSAVTLPAVSASAASKGVTIYYQNSNSWSTVYCYSFYGSGGTGAVWPGDKMVPAGNGWYKYTYTGTKPINVIFSNGAKGQTTNHTPKDLSVSNSAYWFTDTASKSGTAYGGSGNGVKVNTTPESGWPQETVSSSPTTAKSSSTVSTKSTKTSSETSPDTGDNSSAAVAGIICIVALAGAGFTLLMKKAKAD